MNYANIKYCDISNGTGVRTSLFVSGCNHRCPGCFNREAWDFGFGAPFTEEIGQKIIESIKPSYVSGLSLLGGEPMEPDNQRALLPFIRRVRDTYPGKDIWCYTGYTFEKDLARGGRAYCEATDELLNRMNVLVDGRFRKEEYDITLRFRGSANQRLIDLQASLREGRTVLWEDDPMFAGREKGNSIKKR